MPNEDSLHRACSTRAELLVLPPDGLWITKHSNLSNQLDQIGPAPIRETALLLAVFPGTQPIEPTTGGKKSWQDNWVPKRCQPITDMPEYFIGVVRNCGRSLDRIREITIERYLPPNNSYAQTSRVGKIFHPKPKLPCDIRKNRNLNIIIQYSTGEKCNAAIPTQEASNHPQTGSKSDLLSTSPLLGWSHFCSGPLVFPHQFLELPILTPMANCHRRNAH